MIKIGSRIVITREPTPQEDPEETWFVDFEEMIGQHGTVVKDIYPYAHDSIYAKVRVDDYDDFFLAIPTLAVLQE